MANPASRLYALENLDAKNYVEFKHRSTCYLRFRSTLHIFQEQKESSLHQRKAELQCDGKFSWLLS